MWGAAVAMEPKHRMAVGKGSDEAGGAIGFRRYASRITSHFRGCGIPSRAAAYSPAMVGSRLSADHGDIWGT